MYIKHQVFSVIVAMYRILLSLWKDKWCWSWSSCVALNRMWYQSKQEKVEIRQIDDIPCRLDLSFWLFCWSVTLIELLSVPYFNNSRLFMLAALDVNVSTALSLERISTWVKTSFPFLGNDTGISLILSQSVLKWNLISYSFLNVLSFLYLMHYCHSRVMRPTKISGR